MNKRSQLLLFRAKRLLKQNGVPWHKIKDAAREVVVFGSTSVGLNLPNSDLDLLLVGDGKRFKNRQLDVVWKTDLDVTRRRWLESELAGHIAKYGIWLQGNGDWAKHVHVGNRAVTYKRRLIVARAKALEKAWTTLADAYKIKHVVKLRRDLQRLEMLTTRIAIPPTPILDQHWQKVTNHEREILLILKRCEHFRLLTSCQKKMFAPFWNKTLA
jgi:hypothetical protein